jgi:hypothetical protein
MFKVNFNLEKKYLKNDNKPIIIPKIYDKKINYYICSYGGCGSTILCNYLRNYGNVYHIHDRYPPNKLCYVGKENTHENIYNEWFNKEEINENDLCNYKVIFIYRNPVDVIFSRFIQPTGPNIPHLQHIKCINNGNIGLGDIINFKKDLYGLEDFFDNYTIRKDRNYKIYCIKYEDFFTNISLINKILEIPDIPNLYPIKQERKKKYTFVKELIVIYSSLINKMNKMRLIEIIDSSYN